MSEERQDSLGAPSKPSLFDAKSSYIDNLISFMRGGSPVSAQGDTARSVPAAAEAEAPVELPPNFPQAYIGFAKGDARKVSPCA